MCGVATAHLRSTPAVNGLKSHVHAHKRLSVTNIDPSMMTGLDCDKLLKTNKEIADALGCQTPVTVTTVKPRSLPLRPMTGVSEGIHPTFSKEYLRHSNARMEAYKNPVNMITPEEQNKLLDELCDGIGTVATGKDNPPRKRKVKKMVFRSIDESWEGQ